MASGEFKKVKIGDPREEAAVIILEQRDNQRQQNSTLHKLSRREAVRHYGQAVPAVKMAVALGLYGPDFKPGCRQGRNGLQVQRSAGASKDRRGQIDGFS